MEDNEDDAGRADVGIDDVVAEAIEGAEAGDFFSLLDMDILVVGGCSSLEELQVKKVISF